MYYLHALDALEKGNGKFLFELKIDSDSNKN